MNGEQLVEHFINLARIIANTRDEGDIGDRPFAIKFSEACLVQQHVCSDQPQPYIDQRVEICGVACIVVHDNVDFSNGGRF